VGPAGIDTSGPASIIAPPSSVGAR
jgi:hypothetical protein